MARRCAARACEECRRRKRRCNGTHPCELCLYNKRPSLCYYLDPKPSRKYDYHMYSTGYWNLEEGIAEAKMIVDDLTGIAVQYRKVIERLFPSTPLESLFNLTREQLLDLIFAGGSSQPPLSSSPWTGSASPRVVDLETLQEIPSVESGDSYISTELGDAVSDDINALSLSPRQSSCYLGIASISAVIKVIMLIDPAFHPPEHALGETSRFYLPSRSSIMARKIPDLRDNEHCHASGLALIDAFFNYVHQFTPVLDETQFRNIYLHGGRRDNRWLALLNTTFALGSISLCSANHTCHNKYFQKAMTSLNLESLGNVHLETVQTLALLAGHYLHFVSKPNLAYSLTGVAIRMATALGLHKEFSNSYSTASQRTPAGISSEILRQRVWWSLFIVDTWGCMTLGRPTFGRLGQEITVKIPIPKHVEGQSLLDAVSLIENIRFCKIATDFQDAMAKAPTIPHHEINRLDSQLVSWYEQIPLLLKAESSCNESVMIAGTTLRWRFQNLRILLHRPTLLRFAIRRVPYSSLGDDDRISIQKCQSAAYEAIHDMAGMNITNPTIGRAVVWWIFQASLVPLLALYLGNNAVDAAGTLESCRTQVELVITTLVRVETWARTAKRTLEVVSHIFKASQHEHRANISKGPSASGTEADGNSHSNTSDFLGQGPPQLPQLSAPINETLTADNQGFPHASPTESLLSVPEQSLWEYINWGNDDEWCDASLGSHNPFARNAID